MTKVYLSIPETGVVISRKIISHPKFHVLNQCKIQAIQTNILAPANSTTNLEWISKYTERIHKKKLNIYKNLTMSLAYHLQSNFFLHKLNTV